MKKFAVLSIAFVVAMLAFANTAYAQERSLVSVTGEGSVMVTPDIATIFLGVDTQDSNPHAAQQRNSATMTDVLAAITALGVDESDIQTANFNIWPIHSWNMETQTSEITGYNVSNNIRLTVRDIDKVGEILSAASQAGANSASSVTFGVADNSDVYNQALALAVADATAKARVIAQALGQQLGPVQSVLEVSHMGFIPMPRMEMAVAASPMMYADAGGVPIQGGELAITARVQINFYLR